MSNNHKITVWRPGQNEKTIKVRNKCIKCNSLLSPEDIFNHRQYCSKCVIKKMNEHKSKNRQLNDDIRKNYNETINDLRNTVSHSRKGKPHKQASGFHIV